MTPEETRMQELIRRLKETSYAYYVLDNPVISDMQWDQMYDELRRLEDKTGIILDGSPTRSVGGEPLRSFAEHRHINRLWSMDKVQSFDELKAWLARTEKLSASHDIRYYLEYKFDGLTINLTYENGLLVQGATRGNGIVGESVLPQIKTIHTVPLTIPYRGRLEVQGECIMRLSTLNKYNKANPGEKLKNARNAAAGALRNLDPAVTASRHLDAFFYQIGTIDNPPYTNQPEMLDFLREQGFQVSPYLGTGTSLEELKQSIHEVEAARRNLDWLIDGVVIKIGDFSIREQMGYTEKFPRWAVAYKFEAEECVTKLMNVTWELGRTGKLTPLAWLEPVDFYGVTISKATLNNINDIQKKDIAIGCDVWIRRSNDVIPEITGRAGDRLPEETAIEPPDTCPACGHPLVRRGAHLYCMNRVSCKPQTVARLTHFASREAMNIEGLSEKTIEQLYDQLGIRDCSDLYRLTPMDFLMLEGFKEKKAGNMADSLEKSKTCDLDAFLFALGIPNVGRKTARDLADRFGSLEKLKLADFDTLTSIQDIGDTVAGNITEYFSFPENCRSIDTLLSCGVHPRPRHTVTEGPLSGKIIVVTGTLSGMSRKEAEDLIRASGGTASSSVSKKTAFVVAGEQPGSKVTKAESLGIEVIDEAEFIRRAGGSAEKTSDGTEK